VKDFLQNTNWIFEVVALRALMALLLRWEIRVFRTDEARDLLGTHYSLSFFLQLRRLGFDVTFWHKKLASEVKESP